MQLFYAPNIEKDSLLPEEEARHALRVLRMNAGDEIDLIDGRGFFYHAAIEDTNPKHCALTILSRTQQPKPWDYYLHIAVAPTKNIDRMEWFVEKATEVGIDEITFLNCRYSERREIKTARLEKIIVSAMKQSYKATMPILYEMTKFADFITQPFAGRKMIAHCQEGEKPLIQQICQPKERVLVLIGPEGDFSTGEVEQALQAGFEPISLGKSRLRTETAALASCMTLAILNQ